MEESLLSKILNDKKKIILALLSIIIFSVAINVILNYVGFFSISADESGRTIDAYKMIRGAYKGIPVWLPFHTMLIGFGLKIFPDLFLTPRIITSLFGVLAFISFIWMSHELFRNNYITFISAVIGLFFPSRVILSTVPLSESFFFFFIFLGLALFTRWFNQDKNYYLYLSAIAFAFSSSVRYEGWLFSASIPLLLIFLKITTGEIKPGQILITVFIGLIFPLYWFIYQYDVSGDPFYFFYNVNKNSQRALGISFSSILKYNYLFRFIHHNLIYLCFPGLIISFYLFLRNSIIRKWIILILIPFVPLVLISFTGRGIPTHNVWRIPELWNILLIPFTAYFIKNLDTLVQSASFSKIKFLAGGNLKKVFKLMFVPSLMIIVVIYYSFYINRYVNDKYHFTKEELKIGRYVEQHLIKTEPGKKILIEVPDWSYLHIAAASNHPQNFIKSSEGGDPGLIRNPTIYKKSSLDLADLAENNIKFILLKSPELKNRIGHNPFFKGIKNFNEWSLYEIK